MTIAALDDPGQFLLRSKMNEIISVLNSVLASVNTGSLTTVTWVKFRPDLNTIEGQGSRIGSVENPGQAVKVTFDPPFDSANDYAAVCSCSTLAGNDSGFAQISIQNASYVQFDFRNDDGGGGTPAVANIIITYNRNA